MPKAGRTKNPITLDDSFFTIRKRKVVPYEFVLEAISSLSPVTRSMFGCLAVYAEEKIVLILRDKPGKPADNGVWLATTHEHHDSLRRDFPNMRSIAVFGKAVSAWQILPADAPDFEESVMRACDFILEGDPRIGKVPDRQSSRTARSRNGSKPSKSPKVSKRAAKGRAK